MIRIDPTMQMNLPKYVSSSSQEVDEFVSCTKECPYGGSSMHLRRLSKRIDLGKKMCFFGKNAAYISCDYEWLFILAHM